MKKRIVSTLMALCMVLTLLPVQVLAAGGAAPQHRLDNTTIGQYTTLGNGVYTLAEDVSISSTLKITGEATLDLNGNMLRMTGSASVLTVESGGHLTIADSRPDAEERRFAPDGDGLWVLDATGEKSVTGGIITGGTGTLGQWYFYGGGVYVNSGGHLTMEGGSIVGCSAYGANGIYGDGGGVFLKSNYGESIDRTTFTMNGGSIIGCTAGSLGGGVVVARSTFTMNKGSILSCTAKESGGGGVDVQNGGSFTMKDGVISDCVSRGGETWKFGGGVYVENGSFTMDGGRITACRADNTSDPKYGRGGGVALSGQGVFELNAGTIDASCTATGAGGAVYSTGGTLCANGGTIAGGVMNSYGTITGSGGTRFSGSVTNDEGGSIKSGTFEETSDVLNYGTIDPGVKLPGEITVTYMADGAMYAQHFLKKGAMTRQPNDPAKNGYAFDGWCTSDGEAYDFSTEVTDNLTLTAKWRVARFRDVYTEEGLRARLTAREPGIKLAADIDIDSTLVITGELVLDLNGKVLRMTGGGSVFEIGSEKTKERGKLTVVDSDTTKEHKFEPNADHLWVLDETGGTKTVKGGIIYGGRANCGGGVNIENGTLIMEGGSIVGCQVIYTNTSGSGGGVHVSDQSSFEMYPGAGIYGCVASGYGAGDGSGGGVEIDSGWEKSGRFVMHGGTIESCVAGEKGGGVSNDGVFVMEGGIIRNCVAIGYGEGYGSSIRFGGITTISGTAQISAEGAEGKKQHIFGSRSTLTISGNAQVDVSIYLECVLYADGGTVNGEVEIKGDITGSEGATGTTTFTKKVESYSSIENGVFEGKVESYSSIENGVFAGTVESEGTISGGTFTGTVMSKVDSTIEGGTFESAVESYGTISNGTFTGAVTNGGTITGGTFHGEVTCAGRTSNGGNGPLVGGTVIGGSFDDPIQVIYGTIIGEGYSDWKMTRDYEWQKQYVLTYQADGKAYAWQVLGEDFFPVMPQGPDKEGHTFLSWFYKGGKHDGEMVDEGDPPNENRTAVARYATGSGTEQEPCRIGSMEELLLFRLQVNWFGRTDLCAVLTNDIVINSGTFDADGRYTPAAGETVNDLYAIGSKERPYAGTFDGGGYTVRGLCCSNKDIIDSTVQDAVYPAGLFGWLKGATVKNLTVTGYVGGRACVGGIAGHADAGTTILNCRNECIVVSVDQFGGEYGPAQYAGGIVGYNEGSVTACCNTGTVIGVDSVGSITGGGTGAVSDSYNVGAVTASGQNAGGIAGNGGTVSYCYNVGAVTGGVEIANNATVSKCFFLGTQGMSAEKFANGTVLAALIDGRADGTHPWDTECVSKRLSDGGMRLPVLAWQKLSVAHEGGTATCTEKAVCTLCGHAYGDKDAGNHVGGTELRNAKKATCTEDGHTGDTYCKGCGVKLQSGTAIKATGHTGGTATCVSTAVCTVCGQAYGTVDANNHVGGTELRNAKKATCTEDGHTGDTYCKGCGVKLQSGTAIKATGHTGGTATCTEKAVCTVCGQAYGKKDAGNHDLKHTAAKAPGIYARGNTEYWQCKACGKYFADANGTKTISQSDTVIPPRGRTAESGSENGKSSPGTFDAGIGVYGLTAVTSLTGLALLRRKRRDEE